MTAELAPTTQVGWNPRVFMTAEWRNLVLVHYRVPSALLKQHLPPGCELDTPESEPDLHFLSLVAMNFMNATAFGLPVPGGFDFPEINLRFYVQQAGRHGLVFLRQFVPNWTLVAGARATYNQPYVRTRVEHAIQKSDHEIVARSRLEYRGISESMTVRVERKPYVPDETSIEHFLKERYWGFDRDLLGRTFRFRVQRPLWRVYPVTSARIEFDPGRLLGGAWEWVNWEKARYSVVFAEGSTTTIHWPDRLQAQELEPS